MRAYSENWCVTAWVNPVTDAATPEDILRKVNPAAFIPVPNVLPAPARVSANVRDVAITAPRPRMIGFNVAWRF